MSVALQKRAYAGHPSRLNPQTVYPALVVGFLALALLPLSGCGAGGGNATTPNLSPGKSRDDGLAAAATPGQILFTALRNRGQNDANFEIYAVNEDGSSLHRITATTADDADPTWSPDKTRIAFVRSRRRHLEAREKNNLLSPDDPYDLYITRPDGSSPDGGDAKPRFRVSDGGGTIARPRFSADGKSVYFLFIRPSDSDKKKFVSQIARVPVEVPAANADQEKVTLIVAADAASGVAVSPNGTEIAYAKRSGDTATLYVSPVTTLGTDVQSIPARAITSLTVNGKALLGAQGGDFDPVYSPSDPQPTVYISRQLTGTDDAFLPVTVNGIFRIHPGDSSPAVEQVTNGSHGVPSVSPTGLRLAFTSGGRLFITDLSNPQNAFPLTDIGADVNSQVRGSTSW